MPVSKALKINRLKIAATAIARHAHHLGTITRRLRTNPARGECSLPPGNDAGRCKSL